MSATACRPPAPPPACRAADSRLNTPRSPSPAGSLCSNEYVAELGRLEGVKDNMTGGGQPVELAAELLRWVGGWVCSHVVPAVGAAEIR